MRPITVALLLLTLADATPASAARRLAAAEKPREAERKGARHEKPKEIEEAERAESPTPEAELPPPPPEKPPAPVVGSVELQLPAGTSAQGLSELVTVTAGKPLSMREVRRSLERLYGTGRFFDVTALSREAAGGKVDLVFELTNRQYIDRVEFEGNAVLTAEVLRKAIADLLDRRPDYYPELVDKLAARVKKAYGRVGYLSVEVTSALTATEQGESLLTLSVREGGPTRVVSISVAGDPQLPVDEVVKTVGVGQGDVLDLDRLEEGVKALRVRLREDQHLRARVHSAEVSQIIGGAVVMLPLDAGPKIEFAFHGNRSFSDRELQETLRYDGEEPLDENVARQLSEKIAAFYRLMGFAEVRVGSSEIVSPDHRNAFLVFTVEEGEPLSVSEVAFEGNTHFDAKYLRARIDESLLESSAETPVLQAVNAGEASELGLSGRETRRAALRYQVDSTKLYVDTAYRNAIGRIVDLYRADGFLSASVEPPSLEWEETADEPYQVPAEASGIGDRLSAAFPPPAAIHPRRLARVRIKVHEGVQTLVTEVSFPGAPDAARFDQLATIKKGKPLSFYEVEGSRVAVKRALGHQGYYYAKVTDEERLSEDRKEARVAFRVELGPKVRVGKILVEGNQRTEREVVVSALALEENQVLDPDGLTQSQRNLIKLGIFRTAQIRMNAPEVEEEVKDLYVTVEERNTVTVEVGGGYSLIDGPRAFVEYGKVNLFGRALQLQARGKVNYFNASYPVISDPRKELSGFDSIGRRLNLGLHYPRILSLLPLEVGARIDLVHERINRPAYGFTKTSAILGGDFVGTKGFSASLQYELESDRVAKGVTSTPSRSDLERLRFDEGTIYLHSVRPVFFLDLRDDPTNPHRGLLLSGSPEFVQSLGGDVIDRATGIHSVPFSLFLKVSASVTAYLPMGKRATLALSLRGGRVLPLDAEKRSRTIPPKRFFLGGAPTIRGFNDDAVVPEDLRDDHRQQLKECPSSGRNCTAAETLASGKQILSEGAELFTLARGELRFPLSGALDGALFLDAGNLWLDQAKYDPLRLRYTAGGGLRLVTPIGPAAFDLGINLTADPLLNESKVVGHFSIGLF